MGRWLDVLWRLSTTPMIVGLSILLWTGSVTLNNHVLFQWTSQEEYRHLIFVPAGVKLLLLMAFGWRGALGIALGMLTFLSTDLPKLSGVQLLFLSALYAAVPSAVIWAFSQATGIDRPWTGLSQTNLLVLVVLVAVVSSIAFNAPLLVWGVVSDSGATAAVASMVVGDLSGSFVFLTTALGCRGLWRTAV